MTCVLSATVMPAKTTRTRRRLSSQRNRNPSLNEGEAKGPRNMSSKTGFILSSSLQLATSKPTSQYTTHSWNTSSLVHVWAEPLACLLLDEGMARAVREKREEGSPIHNKRPWCITPLSNRSFLFVRQETVLAALQRARTLFPFPILGIDTDNGGEFINERVIAYCEQEQITFTRGRPSLKNDQCFAEQKNGAIVRQVVGYARLVGEHDYR